MPRKPKRKVPASPARHNLSPEPYPSHASPSSAQCLAVHDALLAFHGFPEEFAPFRRVRLRLGGTGGVLDGLVITLLSQNTTDAISCRAFASLKAAFPSWDQVVDEEGMKASANISPLTNKEEIFVWMDCGGASANAA